MHELYGKDAKGRSTNGRRKSGRKKSGRMIKWPNDLNGRKLLIRPIFLKISKKFKFIQNS
jgi:hypothetical protein